MASAPSFRTLLSGCASPFRTSQPTRTPIRSRLLLLLLVPTGKPTTTHALHTSPSFSAAKPAKKSSGGKPLGPKPSQLTHLQLQQRSQKKAADQNRDDPKLQLFRRAVLSVRRVPPPLRMARNRHLRHWTIHRAWQLLKRQQRTEREKVLERQYEGMRNACEELRLTSGPGLREEGYLYRVAMEKKGVYGHNGIPIEYARPQTETPAREAWNHGWKR